MRRLCLVRHGQTDWNSEERFQGQRDVPLNQKGRLEAHSLAQRLIDISFSAIYTSDLKRAKETAEIIAERLHLPITIEPRLREINQGKWEGKSFEVIRNRYAEQWNQRTIDPVNFRPPGGESIAEVADRVYAAVNDIVNLTPSDFVMIVSHGLAIATILCKANGIPIDKAFSHIPENAEPIWVNWLI